MLCLFSLYYIWNKNLLQKQHYTLVSLGYCSVILSLYSSLVCTYNNIYSIMQFKHRLPVVQIRYEYIACFSAIGESGKVMLKLPVVQKFYFHYYKYVCTNNYCHISYSVAEFNHTYKGLALTILKITNV